jgi:DNA polymerase-1
MLKELPVEQKIDDDAKDYARLDNIKEFRDSIKDSQVIIYCDYESEEMFLGTKEKKLCKIGIKNAEAILSDPSIKKIGYDLKKLKLFLKSYNVLLKGLRLDSMLAAYLINPSKPEYTLESIAWDYLDTVLKDAEPFGMLKIISKLQPILEKELEEKSLGGLLYNLEMPLIDVLVEMEFNGVNINKELLEHLSGDIESRLKKLISDIYAQAEGEFNINSPKQLREVLFNKLKLPVIKKIKTGPSTDEGVLRQLSGQHRLPLFLLEYRQLMKLKSTYVDTLPGLINPRTSRIHASFSQVSTETGRLACSQPNLQNIPIKTEEGKKIRKAIVAQGPKDCLVSADYSQIELRILAHLSQDEALIEAFHNNRDVHKATASLIYGVNESDISDTMREVAKRINFGIIYGLSAYGLSRDLEISQEQAQDFIDTYFLRYPGVKEYLKNQIKKASEDGFVTTILGRRRYIPQINNKNTAIRGFAERQAINTPIQGSAADLIKQAMIHIHKAIEQGGFVSRMILQIHDELLFEADQKELAILIELIREKMENVIKLEVPIKVVIKKGRNWLEMEEAK